MSLENTIAVLTSALDDNTKVIKQLIAAQGGTAVATPAATTDEVETPGQKAAKTRARNKAAKAAAVATEQEKVDAAIQDEMAKQSSTAAPKVAEVVEDFLPDTPDTQNPWDVLPGVEAADTQLTIKSADAQEALGELHGLLAKISQKLGTRAAELSTTLQAYKNAEGTACMRLSDLQRQDYDNMANSANELLAEGQRILPGQV